MFNQDYFKIESICPQFLLRGEPWLLGGGTLLSQKSQILETYFKKMKNKHWSVKKELTKKILQKGGFVNAHAHLDRAFTLDRKNFCLANKHLHQKWDLVDQIKKSSTVAQIYQRMAFTIEDMIQQKVQAVCSFIDVDETVQDKAIKAAQKIRKNYGKEIKIKFANQVLKGVLSPKARYWFNLGSEFADIIGGLPGKDRGREEEHLDVLMKTGKKMGKLVHVHVDQLNDPNEKETNLLARKTVEHQMEGQVVAIHSISLSAQKKDYRKKVYQALKKTGIIVISCPTAWIDCRRNETLCPTHNAITPIDEMVPEKIPVALGTDNISDIYKPFSDGAMWTELRFLLESCHFYDLDQLAKIATENGLKALGI